MKKYSSVQKSGRDSGSKLPLVACVAALSLLAVACEDIDPITDTSTGPDITFVVDDNPIGGPTTTAGLEDDQLPQTPVSDDNPETSDEPATSNPNTGQPDSDQADTDQQEPTKPMSDQPATNDTAAPGAPGEDSSENTSNRDSASSARFVESFDTPESLDRLDFYVANGRDFHTRVTSWPADHDASSSICGMPSTTRTVNWPDPPGSHTPVFSTDAAESAYWCAPVGPASAHMMTAFNTAGYAHLDFSPKQTFNDVSEVCFDVNATNLGNRKWQQVVIIPKAKADAVAPRLDWTLPEFRDEGGPAGWGLEMTGDDFMFVSIQNGSQIFTSGEITPGDGMAELNVEDKIKRVTKCVKDLGDGNIEVSLGRWDGSTHTTTYPGSFPNGEVKVIFQDVTYNADKAATESPATVPNSYTWHWDNLAIN